MPVESLVRHNQPPQPPFIFTYGLGQEIQPPMYPVVGPADTTSAVFHQPPPMYNKARIWSQNNPTSWRYHK